MISSGGIVGVRFGPVKSSLVNGVRRGGKGFSRLGTLGRLPFSGRSDSVWLAGCAGAARAFQSQGQKLGPLGRLPLEAAMGFRFAPE